MPKKLSDTQLVLIANAAKRPTLRILPAPKSLNKNAGAISLSIKSMLASGLVDTTPAESGDVVWETLNEDRRFTLVVNAAGLAAIGLDPAEIAGAAMAPPRSRTAPLNPRRAFRAPDRNSPSSSRCYARAREQHWVRSPT